LNAYSNIGRGNQCGRQIADGLGLSYRRLCQIKEEMLERTGYITFTGLLCDWIKGKVQ